MYIKIDEFDAKLMMEKANRDNFTRYGLGCILEYMDSLCDNEDGMEFNPVDIACTFVEFNLAEPDELAEFLSDYGYLADGLEFSDLDSKIEYIQDKIEDTTSVASTDYNYYIFDYNF